MFKTVTYFTLAAMFNGASWWAIAMATPPASGFELVQLGGTAGLVGSLLAAVVALWKDRQKMLGDWNKEVEELRGMIAEERRHARAEVKELREAHRADLDAITERYTAELRSQITLLRQEAKIAMEAERKISDNRYGTAEEP